jgi:hypothetical protein
MSTVRRTFTVMAVVTLLVACHIALQATTTWNLGDVFVGVSNGQYQVYDNHGVFKETIADGLGGFTTGCAFNPLLTRLYTTNFGHTKVVVYDDLPPHPIVQVVDTNLTSPGGHSESIVFASNGDYYVGHPDGNRLIHRYDAAGNLLATFAVTSDARGTDWIDLAANQTTLFYTSEGRAVQRYDIVAGQQTNFAVLPGSGDAFALRLLPPGDGSGGLLVADGLQVKRLDGSGAVVQTYDVPGEDSWFSLNLDPNGTSFWSGNFTTSNFYRFNIATGAIELGPINTNTGTSTLFGLCLKGEPTAAAKDERRMTGGGSIIDNTYGRVTHGFELHCNSALEPNQLEINWNGNQFHLENLTRATCWNDPLIDPNPPAAKFDSYQGRGTGSYNGTPGASAEWKFTDAGEPGTQDTATIQIKDNTGTIVLTASGPLDRGNQQAHNH